MVHHFAKTMSVLDDTAPKQCRVWTVGELQVDVFIHRGWNRYRFEACNLDNGKRLLTFHRPSFLGELLNHHLEGTSMVHPAMWARGCLDPWSFLFKLPARSLESVAMFPMLQGMRSNTQPSGRETTSSLHQGGIFWVETQVLQMYEFGSVFSNSKGRESESSSKFSCELFKHFTWNMLLDWCYPPKKGFPHFFQTVPKNDVYVDISLT